MLRMCLLTILWMIAFLKRVSACIIAFSAKLHKIAANTWSISTAPFTTPCAFSKGHARTLSRRPKLGVRDSGKWVDMPRAGVRVLKKVCSVPQAGGPSAQEGVFSAAGRWSECSRRCVQCRRQVFECSSGLFSAGKGSAPQEGVRPVCVANAQI